MADKLMPKYDDDTKRYLDNARLVLIETKGDLSLPWNQKED